MRDQFGRERQRERLGEKTGIGGHLGECENLVLLKLPGTYYVGPSNEG